MLTEGEIVLIDRPVGPVESNILNLLSIPPKDCVLSWNAVFETFATAHASWRIWQCGGVAFGGFGGFSLGPTLGFQGGWYHRPSQYHY